MELLTTVRDFTREMTARHLAPGTHIRVIIDETEYLISDTSPTAWLPPITPEEQRHQLDRLPHDYDTHASAELVRIIETSHRDTEPLNL